MHHHHMLLAASSASSPVVAAVRFVHHVLALRLQPGCGQLEVVVVGREDAVLLHDNRCRLCHNSFPRDYTNSTQANPKANSTPNTPCASRRSLQLRSRCRVTVGCRQESVVLQGPPQGMSTNGTTPICDSAAATGDANCSDCTTQACRPLQLC